MWRETLPLRDARQYIFVDESGVTTDLLRRYARSLRGTRIGDHTPCSHWQTHTVVAALRPTALTATAVFDGPIDTDTFRAYVEQVLVPTLRQVMSSCSTISRPTSNPRYARRLNRPERSCDFSRPTVPTSIRSNSPSPN